MTEQREIARRTVLKAGASAGAAGLTTVAVTGPARAFPGFGGEVIPWLDQPADIPPGARNIVGHPLVWESLDSRITPNAEFFTVKHYDQPPLTAATYRLDVGGLVKRPRAFSLATLRARPRRTVEFTLECSGNTGLPFFIGGVGNARWTGTPLHSLLRQAGPADEGTEVVFWGADRGPVTIRDNSGITGGGTTGTTEPDAGGGLDLTITEQFARSMSLREAMAPDNLLCFGMNGEPLPPEHGYPVRLIAPGWYGVANVKWLTPDRGH
jgi:DMSO/TMAO reductase YedYZ molybdopterin-dependent catalytic subunit